MRYQNYKDDESTSLKYLNKLDIQNITSECIMPKSGNVVTD